VKPGIDLLLAGPDFVDPLANFGLSKASQKKRAGGGGNEGGH